MTHPILKWQETSKKHPILQVTSSLLITIIASLCSVFTLFWSGQTWIRTWDNIFFVTILIKASWVTNSESHFLGVFFISQVFGLIILKTALFCCHLVRVRPGLVRVRAGSGSYHHSKSVFHPHYKSGCFWVLPCGQKFSVSLVTIVYFFGQHGQSQTWIGWSEMLD